ncbi:MAG TPA: hypothetical protein VE053_08955 [Allosphingosinicella sp.]|nr:hypothetical protein [Allosphingosinicella sp.]
MPGKISLITYEVDGLPFTLSGKSDWRKAIRSGLLVRTLPVKVDRGPDGCSHEAAGDVPELREHFDEHEALAAIAEAPARETPPPPLPDPPSKRRAKRRIKSRSVPGRDFGLGAPPRPPLPDADEPPPFNWFGAFIVAPAIVLLLLAGLISFLTRPAATKPLPAEPEQSELYRVIPPAHLRRHPNISPEDPPLEQELTVRATFDHRPRDTWLRIIGGKYNGFYIWASDVELEKK